MRDMRLKRKDILLYLEMLLVFWFFHFSGMVKYVFFLAWAAIHFLCHQKNINRRFWLICITPLYTVLFGGILAVIHGASFEMIKEMVFVFLPAIAVCVLYNSIGRLKAERYIDVSFMAMMTWFIYFGIKTYSRTDLMESSYAFAFGIYVIYYLFNKKYSFMTVSAICMFLAHKKIVILAVLACVLMMAFLLCKKCNHKNLYNKAVRRVRLIGLACALVLLLYIYALRTNILFSLMSLYGINSMGRSNVWSVFSQYYDWGVTYIGKGLGSVQVILNQLAIPYFSRLHNDVLMYYVELGFVGLFIYIYIQFEILVVAIKRFGVTYKNATLLLALSLFTLICYCTDNVAIYIHYLFPYYLIYESVMIGREERFDVEKKESEIIDSYMLSSQC